MKTWLTRSRPSPAPAPAPHRPEVLKKNPNPPPLPPTRDLARVRPAMRLPPRSPIPAAFLASPLTCACKSRCFKPESSAPVGDDPPKWARTASAPHSREASNPARSSLSTFPCPSRPIPSKSAPSSATARASATDLNSSPSTTASATPFSASASTSPPKLSDHASPQECNAAGRLVKIDLGLKISDLLPPPVARPSPATHIAPRYNHLQTPCIETPLPVI